MWKLLRVIIGAILDFIWKKKQTPQQPTIEDAKVPDNIKRDWNDYVADQLRDKNSSSK